MGAAGAKQRIEHRQIEVSNLDILISNQFQSIKIYSDKVFQQKQKTQKIMTTVGAYIKETLQITEKHEKEIRDKKCSDEEEETDVEQWRKCKQDDLHKDWEEMKLKYNTLVFLMNQDLLVTLKSLPDKIKQLKQQYIKMHKKSKSLETQFIEEQKILKSLKVSLSKKDYCLISGIINEQHEKIRLQTSRLELIKYKLSNLIKINATWAQEVAEATKKLQNHRRICTKLKEMDEQFYKQIFASIQKKEFVKVEHKEEEENDTKGVSEDALNCVVCLDKQKNCLNQTCLHICCCFECGKSLKKCPICRAVMNPVKVYL